MANSPLTLSDRLLSSNVRGFLVDITGVLYDSVPGGGTQIPGSIEAINRLYAQSQVRFVSNESTGTRKEICTKLQRLGFEAIRSEHIFTPAPVAAKYIVKNGLKPHLLVHKDVLSEFAECASHPDHIADCVVLGDAEDELTFENMNTAFRVLLRAQKPLLISLGNGKFYQRADNGPCLDTGAYAACLKFAVEGGGRHCEHIVVGKPEEEYFQSALDDMQLARDEAVMIGDDILSDVGAAQQMGICGVQVRTGKWRPEWEKHATVKPDLIADSLLDAITVLLGKHESIK